MGRRQALEGGSRGPGWGLTQAQLGAVFLFTDNARQLGFRMYVKQGRCQGLRQVFHGQPGSERRKGPALGCSDLMPPWAND